MTAQEIIAELRQEMNTVHTEGLAVITSDQLTVIETHIAALDQLADDRLQDAARLTQEKTDLIYNRTLRGYLITIPSGATFIREDTLPLTDYLKRFYDNANYTVIPLYG